MTMLEKAARALFDAMTLDGDAEFDCLSLGDRNMLHNYARAVLEAVRVPSAEMIKAGREVDIMALRGADSIYTAMIDRALTEGKSNDPE